MAHSFLKAEKIVDQGLGLLQRELVLPNLVKRLGVADFSGAKNDTINVRIPAILEANEYGWRNNRSAPIDYDDLEEFSVPVSLDKHVYSGVKITDEELTLDIASWGEQVARPQIRAVGEKLESYIATAMKNAPYAETVSYDGDETGNISGIYETLVEARSILNKANVPSGERFVLLGADVEAAALLSPNLVNVDQSGSSSALRDAVIGKLAGFTIIGNCNSIDPDFAVAFHPTAFAFANVAPEVPSGATAGATSSYEGLAMRWIRDYDPDRLQDRSIYSSFAGAASVNDGRESYGALTGENVRAVEIEFTGS